MARRLPPLATLRAFEAAVRLGGATQAAGELHVTHGAISRQLQALETWLGAQLFVRRGRRLAPSEAAQRFAQSIGDALDDVEAAAARLRTADTPTPLAIDALPTFAMRWLIPRLPRFQRAHPDIELRLATSDAKLPRTLAGIDVAIRRGPERWQGFRAAPFLAEREVPVASPALLKRAPIRRPADLARHVLLEAETRAQDWTNWLEEAGVPGLQPRGRQRFTHYYLALQAATDGLGVALGGLPLLDEEIAQGRLVAPLAAPSLEVRGYFWVSARPDEPAIAAFIAWLEEEGKRVG
ncbi:MAG: transcriptional regulator GcvA [Rhodospirillales bacterium]|nr:transcriptional regulator GcvA [Rhodospirillales bacterium]